MTRARAVIAAVPRRAWTAVGSLVVIASVALAAVFGAGLQVWRGGVGTAIAPSEPFARTPGSGVVIVPSPADPARRGPARPTATAPATIAVPAQHVATRSSTKTKPASRPTRVVTVASGGGHDVVILPIKLPLPPRLLAALHSLPAGTVVRVEVFRVGRHHERLKYRLVVVGEGRVAVHRVLHRAGVRHDIVVRHQPRAHRGEDRD